MESKYYTPDIEEFYIGFEYEIYSEGLDDASVEDFCGWYKYQFRKKSCFRDIDDIEKFINQIRVKYLDQEDIESLGFILKGKSIDLWFERESIYLRDDGHHLKNIKLQYGLHDQRMRIEFIYTSGEEQIHFEGNIKNKSELDKLIKQLNIE